MPSSLTRLRRRAPATPDDAAALRRELTAFVQHHGVGEALCASVELAAAEALNNVVMHAYRDRAAEGDLELEAALEDGELVVCVRDRGVGMGPRPDSPGCGYGLGLLTRLAGHVCMTDLDPGTEVRLHFTLATP